MTEPTRRPTVMLGSKMPPALVAALAERHEVLGPGPAGFAEAVAALPPAAAARVRAIVTMGMTQTTSAAMAALPALGLVSCLGSGYEGVDLGAARARGIVVTHSPGANAASVADMAIGLMIASVRRMFSASTHLLSGDWEQRRPRKSRGGRGLTGRRIGIF